MAHKLGDSSNTDDNLRNLINGCPEVDCPVKRTPYQKCEDESSVPKFRRKAPDSTFGYQVNSENFTSLEGLQFQDNKWLPKSTLLKKHSFDGTLNFEHIIPVDVVHTDFNGDPVKLPSGITYLPELGCFVFLHNREKLTVDFFSFFKSQNSIN